MSPICQRKKRDNQMFVSSSNQSNLQQTERNDDQSLTKNDPLRYQQSELAKGINFFQFLSIYIPNFIFKSLKEWISRNVGGFACMRISTMRRSNGGWLVFPEEESALSSSIKRTLFKRLHLFALGWNRETEKGTRFVFYSGRPFHSTIVCHMSDKSFLMT